jgi:DNA-directed RNA polymerase alpha subunit
MDKLDQIALQFLCAAISKNGVNDFGSMLWTAYKQAEQMIEYRDNRNKQEAERIERINREKHSDIKSCRDLSIRTIHALIAENVYQFSQLTEWTERDLRKTPNIGSKSISELKMVLANRGLSLKNEKTL